MKDRLQEIAELLVVLNPNDPYEESIISQLIQEATDLQEELGITEFEYVFIPKEREINL